MRIHHKDISDEEFMKFIEGDPLVFKKIFDLYHHCIFNYINAFTKNKEDSEELLQEAFMALFLHRDSLQSASGIYPYLFVIVKRLMISEFRKKVVRAKYKTHLSHNWKEESQSTEEQLAGADLLQTIDAVMQDLTSREQEVYRLHKLEGFSYHEIADQSGLSKNTIKNQLISASKKMKWGINKIYSLLFLFIFISP